jgi:hypothetical protein
LASHLTNKSRELFLRAIRFLFRLLSAITLACAVILAIGDAARSVAASAPQLTPLLTSWKQTWPGGVDAFQAWLSMNIGSLAWDGVVAPVLSLPGFAIFTALALLFYALGRKPQPKLGRLARAA